MEGFRRNGVANGLPQADARVKTGWASREAWEWMYQLNPERLN
jgi:hypothetical protein